MKMMSFLLKILALFLAMAAGFPRSVGAQQGPPPMTALEKEADVPFRAGDWAKAAPAYEAVAQAEPANGRAHYRLGVVYMNLKEYAKAEKVLQETQKMKFAPALGNYNLACALARLGRADDAFAALNAAVQGGFGNVQQIQSDEDLASLRNDARFAAIITQMQRAAKPCEFDDNYKAFDFWVGEWTVRPAGVSPNAPAASLPQSRIEKILNGCVVLENWMPPGGAGGKSFNIYNATTKKWQQFWVDGVGTAILFTGEARDGNMYYTSESLGPNGQKTLGRMSYFNQGPDRLRQLWETSTDDGKTWTVAFDGLYLRKK